MAGAFSAIMNLVGLAAKGSDDQNISAIARELNNTKSITERARKSIFVYPVLFSNGMADLDVDFDVSKFLELQYGIFTLLTVGLNPAIENGTIGEYLNSISAESVEGMSYELKTYDPNQVKSWYDMFSEENKDFFEEYKYIQSMEDIQREKKRDGEELFNEEFMDEEHSTLNMGAPDQSLTKKLTDAAPTMIELKLKIKGYQNDFRVPIALKANPHFLRQEDLAALFDSAVEDKRLLTRIVKLTSGEISFFKDFLFNMDRIKRDQKLYETFGQHPWYQQFISRKEKNRAKRAGIIATSLLGSGKSVLSATSNYLPTASIILTVDELEKSTKMKYGFLLKNDKMIWSILNHLGLLCIGIHDTRTDTFTFYFNGFKKPMIMRRKDLKNSSGGKTEDKMADLMNTLVKRGIM